MPQNVYDQFDVEEKNPYDQFDTAQSPPPRTRLSPALEQTLLASEVSPEAAQKESALPEGLGPFGYTMGLVEEAAALGLNAPSFIKRQAGKALNIPSLVPKKFVIDTSTEHPTPPLELTEADYPFAPGKPIIQLTPENAIKAGSSMGKIIEGMSTPGQIATLPLTATKLAKPIQILYAGSMAEALPGQIEKAVQTGNREDIEPALQSATMLGLMGKGALTKEGVPYARSVEETAAVHGDVRAQPGGGEGQVPVKEGGARVLASPEQMAEAAQIPLERVQAKVRRGEPLSQAEQIRKDMAESIAPPTVPAEPGGGEGQVPVKEAPVPLRPGEQQAFETTESLVSRTKVGEERDQAFSERAKALKTVAQSLKPGDVLVDEDGVRRVVRQVSKDGTLFVDHEGQNTVAGSEFHLEPGMRLERSKGGLTADDQDYLDEERKGMGAGIEVGSEHLEEGQPFAPNEAATINRKTGKVVINPEEFSKSLADLPPEERSTYVKSLIAQERDHLETTDKDADEYAAAMSGVEKVMETRVYTGKWTRAGAQAAHGRPFTDRMLGYESIARRLAQLRKMSPTETVMTVGRERWKMEQLNTLQRIVSRIMETLPTERGNVRRSLLEKVQGNLDAARFVAAGGNPSSLRRPQESEDPKQEQYATDKFVSKGVSKPALGPKYFHDAGDAVNSPDYWMSVMKRFLKGDVYQQESAYQAGLFLRQLGEEKAKPVIAALEYTRRKIIEDGQKVRDQLQTETDPQKKMALLMSPEFGLGTIVQFPREIIEAAFDEGSAEGMVPKRAGAPLKHTVESVKALERTSGRELTATESLAQRLETPRPSSLRRPKALSEEEQATVVPRFAARFDAETLMQRPGWVEPASMLDKVLGELREKNDPLYGKDIAPIWKTLTPKQRQDLAARGWVVTADRNPFAVILKLSQDVPAARNYYGMQAKLEAAKRKAAEQAEGPSSLRRPKTAGQKEWKPTEGYGPKGTLEKWFNSSGELHEAPEGHKEFAYNKLKDVIPEDEAEVMEDTDLYREMFTRGWVRAVADRKANTLWISSRGDISPKVRQSAIDWGIEQGMAVKRDPGHSGRGETLYDPSQMELPMSLRRPKAPKEHPELLLPPVKGTAEVERGGFRQPAAGEIDKMTDQFFSNVKASGKLPSFEEFSNTLRAQFGSQVTRDSIYYAWQDSLTKHLMQATGDELARMLPEVGVKRDVAEALQPSERDPYIGKIPDVMNEEQMASQIEYVRKMFSKKPWMTQEEFKRKYGPQIAQKFNVPFQRRYAAIGAIMDKLTQKAGDAPEKPWDRKEIGPEDIGQTYDVQGALPRTEAEKVQAGEMAGQFPTIESRRLITRIPAEEAGDAKRVGELATANAAVDATGKAAPPRTVSKNVMALLDRDGKVTLVSTWRDPRTGPKITNPDGASLPSEKITDKLLKSWSPMVVMTLRDPVQKFHQKFDSVNDFEKWFGDVGIEGTPGIRTSSFTGPMAGITREQAGLGSATTIRPKESMLPPPPAEFVSPTAREISTLRGRAPTEVAGAPRGTPAEPPPPAVPHEPEMLSPEAQQALSAELAQGENPYMGEAALRTLAHREVPKKKYTLESSLRYGVSALRERDPSSLRRAKQVTNDETIQLFKSLRAIGARRVVKRDLPRILDGQERVADQYARQVGQLIRMVSAKSASRADTKQAQMVRAAAKAVIASTNRAMKYEKTPPLSGFTPKGLEFLRKDIASARTKAELWGISRDPVKRLWSGKISKAADRLEKEIDYARDHWDDPELQRTAAQILKEGKDEIDFENANGFDVKERAYYLPGRYEGEFWSDQQVAFAPFGGTRKLLGEQYRGGKRFRDMYEAIAHGPFIPGSYDPAVLMESRVRSGRYKVAAAQAREMWKDLRDPETGKPIAVAPKSIPKEDPQTGRVHMEYVPASLDYPHLIWPTENKRGVPLSVSEPYVKMIRSLSRTSQIADMPGGRQALLGASMLKHGWLLIGDMFHFSRLAQYGATLSGKRWWEINPNFKGGFAVLNWRLEDMPEAVEKGFITQEAADWAKGTIQLIDRDGTFKYATRHEVGRGLLGNGLNASRVIDALYKDAIRNIPLVGEPWHKVIGPYNRWLFDKYTSGLMLQKGVENFERLHDQFPGRRLPDLLRDVVRGMNIEFGNMGRQGIFRNPTFRDMAQIVMLAPMWREGIIMKEVETYTRLAKAAGSLAKGDLRAAQYHVSTPVTRSMLRGLAGYFVLTQVLNLISRKQFTWQNNERDHKFDAFIPTGKGNGFWLSPMSVFMEMTHDVNRLMGSRPRAHDVMLQIGANALGPVGKAAKVIASGEDEFGRRITKTTDVWKEAAGQLAPLPLSFGAPAKAIGHAIAPESISPPRRGAVQRQMLGWAGMKVQPAETPLTQTLRLANDFVEKNNLRPDAGFFLQPTDAPSYAALRSALRNDDVKEARRVFTELRKTHPLKLDSKGNVIKDPIAQAMATWAQRPMTGSWENEAMFLDSLNDQDFELFNNANVERQDLLNKYIDWYVMHSGEITGK